MKFSVAFIVASVASLAAAQSQCLSTAEAIPSCGQSCLTAAGSSYGCVYTDFACQCSHSSQINNAALTQCVLSACSSNVQSAESVSSAAVALCSCVSSAGGSAKATGATSTAAVPNTTKALGSVAAGMETAAPTTAKTTGSGEKISTFTGGAAGVAGPIGGLFAGVLAIIAAL